MDSQNTVIRFQELANKDRILCTHKDGDRYLQASVLAMELIDEIGEFEAALRHLNGIDGMGKDDYDRSTLLILALRAHRDQLESNLEHLQIDRGLL